MPIGRNLRAAAMTRFVVLGFVAVMGMLHFQDPRSFGVKGPREGKQYFFPSEAVTANGKFIPAETLMMDRYCLECHKDAYDAQAKSLDALRGQRVERRLQGGCIHSSSFPLRRF